MSEPLARLREAYDPLPAPALLARAGEAGFSCAYKNPAAAALVGGREAELLAAMAERLKSALSSGKASWYGPLWGRRLAAQLACYGEGLVVVLLWDVTEEIRIQQERIEASSAALRSALDAANAASKAKSDFLSNMSHDIRTPLNAIIGMTTIARAHIGETERVEDCLEKIGLSSRHLLALINDILDMSRIESGKVTLSPEDFTMADFIHSLMAVFRPQADKKRQRVLLDFTGIRCEKVRGDQLRIQQVLINILSNAVKFTPEEGAISIRVRETGELCRAGRNYAYYEFAVEDTGIGMSPEFLQHVFDPFERAAGVSRIEGTGLGMAITRNLVEMMNGTIAVESREGEGSRFTVTLPLEQLHTEEAEREELRGLRVLAADADGAATRNLKELLGDLEMTCDVCLSAPEALELAADAHIAGQDYFAILLSWHLPPTDGVAACRELREMLGPDMPILVMSSYEWTLSSDEMRKHGVSGFIPKPLFRSRLLETLGAFTPGGRERARLEGAPEQETFPGRRLLLVEDNEINREIGVELIEMLGAEVECAENGAEAVERFSSAPPGRYDLIFMDIQMPVMNGLEAARAIRALPREDAGRIPIVAMSANAFVEDIRACEQAGMNDHVPKPVSLESLADALRRHLPNEKAGGDAK